MGIGFFAPLPLAMMLPFMAGQSLIMGESFGKGFQYGKRKISSMSNEEFNAMNADDLGRELSTDYSAIIPHLEQSVRASADFQRMIIEELIKIIPNFIDQLLSGGGDERQVSGGGAKLPPAGIPGFITPIIGPTPGAILDNPEINPPPAPPPPGLTAIEKYASKWMDFDRKTTNFSNITIDEARYLLNMRSKGLLRKMSNGMVQALVKKWESIQIKPKTLDDVPGAIDKSGLSGALKQLALWFNDIRILLKRTDKSGIVAALNKMKFYNQLAQRNRQYGLVLDTAKSILAKRPIPKT